MCAWALRHSERRKEVIMSSHVLGTHPKQAGAWLANRQRPAKETQRRQRPHSTGHSIVGDLFFGIGSAISDLHHNVARRLFTCIAMAMV